MIGPKLSGQRFHDFLLQVEMPFLSGNMLADVMLALDLGDVEGGAIELHIEVEEGDGVDEHGIAGPVCDEEDVDDPLVPATISDFCHEEGVVVSGLLFV